MGTRPSRSSADTVLGLAGSQRHWTWEYLRNGLANAGIQWCESMNDRYEPDEWTVDGEKITDPGRLAKIREAADRGGIVVRHWFYRGARGPDIRGFTDFEEFETYLKERAKPGDAFDVWSVSDICDFERALAKGKLPDADGCVPKRGAY